MKLVKSLLLGSAAGLVAVAGASAADLGAKKPTAVEYVRTCPQYGAGFFVVPGTTSCLKLIGRVRADYIMQNARTRANEMNRFRVRGYVGYDHRTATEYGLLRTYVRAFFQHENNADSTTLEYAFVQFAGFTFGRVTPIYEHGWNQFYMFSGQGGIGYHSDISYVNSLGYTFNAGGGLSVSVALDDGRNRRVVAAGHSMPDITGAIVYDQSWGTIRVSGAAFQIRAANAVTSTKYGYAIEGGARFNLPMLSRGSNIWIAGGYAEGSTSYSGFGAFGVGAFTAAPVDAVIAAGSIRLTKSMNVMGAIQYFVAPTVSISLGGSWATYDPFGPANTVRVSSIIGQVAWNPAPGFLIGLEGAYRQIQFSAGAVGGTLTNTRFGGVSTAGSKSEMVGRLRVQRDF